ncbi:MAG TPA: amidohydrolase family protein [Pirellulales bacterium]|nr:amidohydrolase family protein [Pirellulales bacterium]
MTPGIIDSNVWFGRWPFRRLPGDEPADLLGRLQRAGVRQAWVGSFDALFHRDMGAVNERLAADCRALGDGEFCLPFGTVNPKLPDWEDDLRRCREAHHMRGIRLAPAYHGYPLDDPSFVSLVRRAAEQQLIVELLISLEDQRTQPARGRVPTLDMAPLIDLVKQASGLQLVLLGAFHASKRDVIERLAAAGEVYFEIATLEGMGGLTRLIEWVSVDRILFGSAAPFFYISSAVLKLEESDLAGRQLEQICFANAERLIPRPR